MNIFRPLILFIIVFIATLFIGKGIMAVSSIDSSVVNPSLTDQPISNQQQNLVVVRKTPVRLIIPSLKIVTMSESVGMDQQGRMDVPKDVVNVAWYQLGVKPGEVGNAVFAGHYDKPDGSPAVFYDLNQLQSGDELIVEDEDGKAA
jgi:sortase (surface protein transpeptidase)